MTLALALFADRPDAVREAIARNEGLVSMVELRLDETPLDAVRPLVADCPLPVLATCLAEGDGGRSADGLHERVAKLKAAVEGGARWVDWPAESEVPSGLRESVPLVRSWHEPSAGSCKEPLAVLRQIESVLREGRGDIAKLVLSADHEAQAARVLPLYSHTTVPLLAFAQGEAGRNTRALALALGAPWAFVADEKLGGTAPGQFMAAALAAILPPEGVGRETAVFGVAGSPIAHSRSPLLYRTAFRMAGHNAIFLPFEPTHLATFLSALRAPQFRGMAVTAPFKRAALALADTAAAGARRAGSANTLVRQGSGWHAIDTDGPAACDALSSAGFEGGRVLVLGGGGAARSVAAEAEHRNWEPTLASRKLPEDCFVPVTPLDAVDPAAFGAVVQATPVGQEGVGGCLLPDAMWQPDTVLLDMVYTPRRTPFLERAASLGCRTVEGKEMFLRQFCLQYEHLVGEQPPSETLARVLELDLRESVA